MYLNHVGNEEVRGLNLHKQKVPVKINKAAPSLISSLADAANEDVWDVYLVILHFLIRWSSAPGNFLFFFTGIAMLSLGFMSRVGAGRNKTIKSQWNENTSTDTHLDVNRKNP